MMIDTHCHFDMMPNPERYIREKEDAGDIVIGMTNLPSHFQMGIDHVKTFRHVRLSLGMHPLLAEEGQKEMSLFRRYVDETSYIGEIGLDFSREGYCTKELQIGILHDVLSLLRGKKKIISVHSRRAEKELLDLLTEYDIKNVIFHWYSGSVGLIDKILERGYYFLTETDAPYNERTNIRKVLQYMEMSEEEVYHNLMSLLSNLKKTN